MYLYDISISIYVGRYICLTCQSYCGCLVSLQCIRQIFKKKTFEGSFLFIDVRSRLATELVLFKSLLTATKYRIIVKNKEKERKKKFFKIFKKVLKDAF